MKIKVIKQEDLLLLKRALKYVFLYKIKFILAFLCIAGGIVIGIIQPLYWGGILVSLFQKSMDGAVLNIAYSLIFGILAIIISYLQEYIFASLNQNIMFDMGITNP